MTRTRWIISAITLGLIWLLGVLLLLPRMQQELVEAAQRALAGHAELRGRLGALKLSFDGQQAVLRGAVRSPRDRDAIVKVIKHELSAGTPVFGSVAARFNPVGSVSDGIDIAPYPPGWLMISATGKQARLLGSAASDFEARDLARSVQALWSAAGGDLHGMPTVTPSEHDEANGVAATLRGLPVPREIAQASIARVGQSWIDLPLQQSDEALREMTRLSGVDDEEWQHQVQPALHQLRDLFSRQQQDEVQRRRLEALPPGHLFFAVQGEQAVLRGEVGSEAVKQEALREALTAFTDLQILDEIRVNAARRPVGDFGPFTSALLPVEQQGTPSKSCFIGFSGDAWRAVDWQTAAAEQSWRSGLPSGLEVAQLTGDSASVSGWLQGEAGYERAAPSSLEPSFLTLAIFGEKALLGGQVAEESTRVRFLAAAQRAYGPRVQVHGGAVRMRGGCRPFSNILHTLGSLPPAPAAKEAGIFAIAVPGGAWITMQASARLVSAGGLARSGMLPRALPAGLVEELSADAIEQLRLHLDELKSSEVAR